jgi:histidinol-phosphate aminotransferase
MTNQHLKTALTSSALTRPDWTTGAYRDKSALWLDKNENLDPQFLEFTKGILHSLDPLALCTYPECAPLYKKISQKFGISDRRLLLTAGSDGAIRMVFEAFIDPGDLVLHTAPTFAMYSVYSKMYGAKELSWEYAASAAGPDLRFEDFLNYISEQKPKLVCLPNPDSPTGTVLTAEQMSRLIKHTRELNCLLLVDEAYFPFYSETVIHLESPNLLVARTFAKAWGLAGLRIGFLAASTELMPFLHKVRPMYEVNTLAVMMMEKMLDCESEMKASVERLQKGKNYFLNEMERLGYKTLRGHGNFSHVAFGSDQKEIVSELSKTVLFRPDFNEACLKGYSRFSSTTVELFQNVVEQISHVKGMKCLSQ